MNTMQKEHFQDDFKFITLQDISDLENTFHELLYSLDEKILTNEDYKEAYKGYIDIVGEGRLIFKNEGGSPDRLQEIKENYFYKLTQLHARQQSLDVEAFRNALDNLVKSYLLITPFTTLARVVLRSLDTLVANLPKSEEYKDLLSDNYSNLDRPVAEYPYTMDDVVKKLYATLEIVSSYAFSKESTYFSVIPAEIFERLTREITENLNKIETIALIEGR